VKNPYEVAAFYFPNYHPHPWNARWHGPGWTEWELVKTATPRFEGHQQPKVPAWGFEDESDPQVMAKKIDAAADHGLSAFIFDWYWYEQGPYLERALEEGFLKAPNNSRLKFSLMWANHDWLDIQPALRNKPYNVLAKHVPPEKLHEVTKHILETYFRHPSYWRVDGGLFFSIYEVMSLVETLGGFEQTRAELDLFRKQVREAGLGEIHLNACVWGVRVLPTGQPVKDPNEVLAKLGFDSITSYTWLHHQPLKEFPKSSYAQVAQASQGDWAKFSREFHFPYFPHVSMGWDSSPRTIQSDVFENLGYPYTPILDGNTPEEFEKALQAAKDFLDKGKLKTRVLTVNAWNEWTEGSYLEPDTTHGMAYLEAIRKVFGGR
jgi:hypothetical protein